MPEKYNLKKMLEEIEDDKKVGKVLEKKWASQKDIKEMIKQVKKKKKKQ
ncbi:MAG: hypothetical protein V3S46_04680 [Nitrospinota bacterium]